MFNIKPHTQSIKSRQTHMAEKQCKSCTNISIFAEAFRRIFTFPKAGIEKPFSALPKCVESDLNPRYTRDLLNNEIL